MNNSWHKDMYDEYHAISTLNSKALKEKASREVSFILSKLNISKSSKILDVPCGTGRHSVLFAGHGLSVTGVDISNSCLKIAKSKNFHKNVAYKKGDMGNLSQYKHTCDVVLNLFSSFGYFSTDSENKKILKNFYRTLKPGGKLVLSTINRDWLLKVFSDNDWHERDGKYILNKRKYDPKTHYNEAWTTVIDKKSKKEKTYYHRIRLYSKEEIVNLLKDVGFKNVKVYGDFKGNKFRKFESTHPFYFAAK